VIIYREPQQLKAFVDDQMYLIDEDPAYFEFLAQLIKSLMTTQGESLLTKRTIAECRPCDDRSPWPETLVITYF
jgi:hypothetical protein